jgi:hypothetical protein
MECLAVYDQDLWMALYIIFVFVVFISGIFLGVLISPYRRTERERLHAWRIAAEGRPRRDRKVRIANLLAVVAALIVASGVVGLSIPVLQQRPASVRAVPPTPAIDQSQNRSR